MKRCFFFKNENQFMIEVLTKVHNNFKMNCLINISNLCEKKNHWTLLYFSAVDFAFRSVPKYFPAHLDDF